MIRMMVPDDVPVIAEIEKECFSRPWSERNFFDSLNLEEAVFLVATEKTTVSGYVGCYLSFDEAEITNVAVKAAARRRGYAKQLLAELEKTVYVRGVRCIFLEVRRSNEPAISLYREMGYVTIGERPGFYRNPTEDALLMKKELKDNDKC